MKFLTMAKRRAKRLKSIAMAEDSTNGNSEDASHTKPDEQIEQKNGLYAENESSDEAQVATPAAKPDEKENNNEGGEVEESSSCFLAIAKSESEDETTYLPEVNGIATPQPTPNNGESNLTTEDEQSRSAEVSDENTDASVKPTLRLVPMAKLLEIKGSDSAEGLSSSVKRKRKPSLKKSESLIEISSDDSIMEEDQIVLGSSSDSERIVKRKNQSLKKPTDKKTCKPRKASFSEFDEAESRLSAIVNKKPPKVKHILNKELSSDSEKSVEHDTKSSNKCLNKNIFKFQTMSNSEFKEVASSSLSVVVKKMPPNVNDFKKVYKVESEEDGGRIEPAADSSDITDVENLILSSNIERPMKKSRSSRKNGKIQSSESESEGKSSKPGTSRDNNKIPIKHRKSSNSESDLDKKESEVTVKKETKVKKTHSYFSFHRHLSNIHFLIKYVSHI